MLVTSPARPFTVRVGFSFAQLEYSDTSQIVQLIYFIIYFSQVIRYQFIVLCHLLNSHWAIESINAGRAELLWRLGVPISAIVLALLAIPLSFVNPRAGRSANMLLALFAYLLYNNLLTISQAWVSSGRISFEVGVFAVHAFMLCLLPILFFRRIAVLSFTRFSR